MLDGNDKSVSFVPIRAGDEIGLENGNLLRFFGDKGTYLTFHNGDNKALCSKMTQSEFLQIAELIVEMIFGLKLDLENSRMKKFGNTEIFVIPIINPKS